MTLSAVKLFTHLLIIRSPSLQSLPHHFIPDRTGCRPPSPCPPTARDKSHLHYTSTGERSKRAETGQPYTTGTIAPSRSRLPDTIHLRTLSSQSQPSTSHQPASLPVQSEKTAAQHLESKGPTSYSSATDSDEFSLWSDTGDIAEQFADEEDPLQIELDPLTREGQALNGGVGGRRKKRVRYQDQGHLEEKTTHPGLAKEDIPIPQPAPRRIAKFEKLLAIIMAPSDPQTARTRGLVGKPLLYDWALLDGNFCVRADVGATDILRAFLCR